MPRNTHENILYLCIMNISYSSQQFKDQIDIILESNSSTLLSNSSFHSEQQLISDAHQRARNCLHA